VVVVIEERTLLVDQGLDLATVGIIVSLDVLASWFVLNGQNPGLELKLTENPNMNFHLLFSRFVTLFILRMLR
jgi:hypothetical protein